MNSHKILLITLALSCISLIASAAPDRRKNVNHHASVMNSCLESQMEPSEEEIDSLSQRMYDAILLTNAVSEPTAKSKVRLDGESYILPDGTRKPVDAIEKHIAKLIKLRNKLFWPMFESYVSSQKLDPKDPYSLQMFLDCLDNQKLDRAVTHNYRQYDRMIWILKSLLWKRDVEVALQRNKSKD